MTIITDTFTLLFGSVVSATDALRRVVVAAGVPFSLFLGTIVCLMVINTVFLALRYRTIGALLSDGDTEDNAYNESVLERSWTRHAMKGFKKGRKK